MITGPLPERYIGEGNHPEGGIQTIETLEHADGLVRYSIVNKCVIPGLDENAGMVGGVAIDITDLRHAEEALRSSEERLRLSQQVARVGAFDWNIEDGCQYLHAGDGADVRAAARGILKDGVGLGEPRVPGGSA